MKNTFGSNTKICATCSFWDGNRRPSGGAGFVEVQKPNGKCYLIMPQGRPMESMQYCPSWDKWKALR